MWSKSALFLKNSLSNYGGGGGLEMQEIVCPFFSHREYFTKVCRWDLLPCSKCQQIANILPSISTKPPAQHNKTWPSIV